MEREYNQIEAKPCDFKICKDCGHINFYEKEQCFYCDNKDFYKEGLNILEVIKQEIDYYKKEGYTEEQAYNIFIDV